MPPHRGHQYLFDFATNYAEDVTIFVCTLPEEPIPGDLRFRWVQEMNPDSRVVHITERIPEAQRDQPNSFSIWAETIRSHMSADIDFVFASESYGFKLAEALSARFVSVDAARHVFPVSATQIRSAPYDNWRYIPEIVRPYFLRRLAVIESRSDGEGAFAHDLARALKTVVVQDYLTYWESLGLSLRTEDDLRHVLVAQRASERALAPHANGILIIAGEPLGIAAEWIERGMELPDWFESEAEHYAHHYLLVALPGTLGRTIEHGIESIGGTFTWIPEPDRESLDTAVEIAKSMLVGP